MARSRSRWRGAKRFNYTDAANQSNNANTQEPPPFDVKAVNGAGHTSKPLHTHTPRRNTQSAHLQQPNSEQSHGTRQRRSRSGMQGNPWSPSPSHAGRGSLKRRMNDEPLETRPRQRQRVTGGTESLLDTQYANVELSQPKAKDYPLLPRSFWRERLSHSLPLWLKHWGMQSNVSYANHPTRRDTRECILRAGIAGEELHEVRGHGRTNKTALDAAWLQYLSYLHTSGTLSRILANDVLDSNLDGSTLKEENDAHLAVYNYAARFTLLPRFRDKAFKASNKLQGLASEVSFSLPEQGIEVSARADSTNHAVLAASVKFKAAAEKYHAEKGSQAIAVRESTALNLDNMRNFWDFYKYQKNKATITVEVQQNPNSVKGGGGDTWRAQAYLGSAKSANNAFLKSLGMEQKQDSEAFGDYVVGPKKKEAESLAWLVAAVELCKKDPNLLDDFRKALSSGSGGILVPLNPTTLQMKPTAAGIMQETLRNAHRAGLSQIEQSVLAEDTAQNTDTRVSRHPRLLAEHEQTRKSQILKDRQTEYEADTTLAELRRKRAALPMSQYRTQVLDQIRNHNFSVIVGATGSGKTTQVPQLLLDDAISRDEGAMCNVICTQPRRLAATSVAQRVAAERHEKLQNTVGYHVRFDAKRPMLGGSITYCTTGILLQQLQASPDEILDRVSHIVIDEVHERDILIDFLMIFVKNAVQRRKAEGKPCPKVVLMSATINSELFAGYFQETTPDGQVVPCPSLSVPGRTFPVAEKYLHTLLDEMKTNHGSSMRDFLASDRDTKDYLDSESNFKPTSDGVTDNGGLNGLIDWKRERKVNAEGVESTEKEDALVPIHLVAASVMHICQTSDTGAILVFLPGYDEMKKTSETLHSMRTVGFDVSDPASYRLHMLHSSVPSEDQAKVFEELPAGCRRIILSTNIAETSVTIPDVQYIVDTGKLREKRYDQTRRITKLQCTWISKSNAKQRAGRAGRVQNGHYYALYSKDRFDTLSPIGLPEMLRSDLQEVCLDIKAQHFSTPIRPFLAQAIEPPPATAVDVSVSSLQALQALTEDEDLTALGRLLAALPVHPSLGKMIVLGIIFRCLDPMIVLGAAISQRPIFTAPPERRAEAYKAQIKFVEDTQSDHYATIAAFNQLRHLRRERGRQTALDHAFANFIHFGSFTAIENTASEIEDVLVNAGLIPRVAPDERFEHEFGHPSLNANSSNVAIIKALALAGLHPNLGLATKPGLFRTEGEKNVLVHPSSKTYPRKEFGIDDIPTNSVVSYSTLAKSNDGKSTLMRDISVSDPLMAVIFGGKVRLKGSLLEMDRWLPFFVRGPKRNTDLLLELRNTLDRVLSKSFQDLAMYRQQRNTELAASQNNEYLADDQLRSVVADGIRDLLAPDEETNGQTSAYDDYGNTRYASGGQNRRR